MLGSRGEVMQQSGSGRDDDDRDLPAVLPVPAVTAVCFVIDGLPQARIAGIVGRDDARPGRCPHRPTWISTSGLASMLNSHPGGRSEPPLEATTR